MLSDGYCRRSDKASYLVKLYLRLQLSYFSTWQVGSFNRLLKCLIWWNANNKYLLSLFWGKFFGSLNNRKTLELSYWKAFVLKILVQHIMRFRDCIILQPCFCLFLHAEYLWKKHIEKFVNLGQKPESII